MDGSAEAVRDLLNLTYGLSCGKRDIKMFVYELIMHGQQPRLHAIIRLTQKYSMPMMLHAAGCLTARHDPRGLSWQLEVSAEHARGA